MKKTKVRWLPFKIMWRNSYKITGVNIGISVRVVGQKYSWYYLLEVIDLAE